MNILVTGGAGFIGSQLCERLLNDGHKVVCVDDLSAGLMENLLGILSNPNFIFIKQDVNDVDVLTDLLCANNIEQIYHLAANSSILDGSKNTEIDFNRTFKTTFSVLEAMKQANVKKLFFSSTSAIYGNKNNQPMVETMGELFPENYYGGAKLASEAYISAFAKMNGFDVTIFRFANVIGPHLTHGVIFDFIKKLEKNPNKLEILGDGQQTKPYIYSLDLIDAICQKTYNIASGINIFNCGVESCTSVTEIADVVCKKLGLSNVEYCYTGSNVGWKGDVPKYQFDISKIKDTGWVATYTSTEAVEKTVDDWLIKDDIKKHIQTNQILNTIKTRHKVLRDSIYLKKEYQLQAYSNAMLEQNTSSFNNQQTTHFELDKNTPKLNETKSNNVDGVCQTLKTGNETNKVSSPSLLSIFEANEQDEIKTAQQSIDKNKQDAKIKNEALDFTDKTMQDEAKSLEEEFINEISAENNFVQNQNAKTESPENKKAEAKDFNTEQNDKAAELFEEDEFLKEINQNNKPKTIIVADENDIDDFSFDFEEENVKEKLN